MSEPITNSKRVVKNTLLLSVRMLLIMLVSLYTVRVVLETLGVIDYGIYNVIGGTVLIFNFLSRTMAGASQRFFSFELTKGNSQSLKQLFQTNVSVYLGITLLILLVSATLGFWFINTRMVIPDDRLLAANWIFVFAILSFIARLLATPYQAVLIAHEKMNLFAWLSLAEAIELLAIVFVLTKLPFDKLICYGALVCLINAANCSAYGIICRRKFPECRFGINTDKTSLKKLIGYTGWNLYGSSATILRDNGINILLNLFFGPVINAARGVAYQAQNAIYTFATNFTIALKPQIVKNYAAGQSDDMIRLICRGSRMCFGIMLLLTLPVMLQTDYIFTLWLKQTPDYTVLFTRLVLITAIIDAAAIPLVSGIEATGKVKRYQLITGSVQFAVLPLSYLLLRAGAAPYTPMTVTIGIATVIFALKVVLAKKSYGLPVRTFIGTVLFRVFGATGLSYCIAMVFIRMYNASGTFADFIVISAVCAISVVVVLYAVVAESAERTAINNFIRGKVLRSSLH